MPFRIMDLPFELRRMIFSLVLSRSYPLLQYPSDGSADALRGPVDVRLFAVSRKVFAEAVKVFYGVNSFYISTKPSTYYKDIPLFIRQSTGKEAPRPTDLIKGVDVSIHPKLTDPTVTDEFLFLWEKLCEFLRTCRNLQKVGITAVWAQSSDEAVDRAIGLQIDGLTEMLVNIRSTNEAVFSDVTISKNLGWVLRGWRIRQITGIVVQPKREEEAVVSTGTR